jgi:hypothetical protein
MSRRLLSILCAAGIAAVVAPLQSATAQDTKSATATPAAPASALAPKHNCKQPERPNQFASENEQKVFIKQVDAYRDCLLAFRSEMSEKAKAYVEAGNKAIDEFNAFAGSLAKR